MATLRNTTINDSGYLTLPTGSTAARPGSPTGGMTRYNTDTGSFEFYSTSTGWISISGINVTGVSPTSFNGESGTSFTVTGTGFVSGCIVKFVTAAGTEYSAGATTFNSSTQLTATTPRDFTVAEEPISVRVYSPNGQVSALIGTIDCGGSPTWNTPAGSLGSVYVSSPTTSFTVSASDPDAGATIAYSLASGSLPTGFSINASTGVISGTATIPASQTTYSFTIRATDNAGNIADRGFSITVNSAVAVYTTFSYTGANQSFTPPSGVSSVWVKCWGAGGGTGGSNNGTFGGAGGFSTGTLAVSAGQTYIVVIGGGGNHSRNAVTTGGFGGGGDGGNPSGYEGSASAGGYTGLFYQNVAFANARIIAGGGGGGAGVGNNGYANSTNQTGFGGAGGGTNGQAATGNYASANGGTQNAGGNRNGNSSGTGYTDGGQLSGGRGGNFHSATNHSAGGGGGGGYYGGGGGRGGEGGITAGDAGGGGSGYIGGVTNGSSTTGQGAGQYNVDGGRASPGGTTDTAWNGTGGYSGYGRSSGQPGYLVIMI